jgi:hypothetical protein
MGEHYTQLKDGEIVGFSHCTPEAMQQYAAKRGVQFRPFKKGDYLTIPTKAPRILPIQLDWQICWWEH